MLLVFIFSLAAPAGALEVTKFDAAPEKIMVFSGVLEVKGISLHKNAIVMPVTEYNGRTYEDIRLLSKGLYSKIEACLSKGACKNAPGAAPKIILAGVKPLKSKVRVANAELVFDGELLVTAGVVKSSREPGKIWVAWPEIFKMKNAALKAEAEKLIKEAYIK